MSDDEEDDNVAPKKYDAISPESPHASLIYSSESGNGDAIIDQWSDLESTDESDDDGCNESDAASTHLSEHVEETNDDSESDDFVGVESKNVVNTRGFQDWRSNLHLGFSPELL